MSKFDDLILQKKGQLNEVLTAASASSGAQAQPGLTGGVATQAQPGLTGNPQNQQGQQQAQQTQQQTPEQAAAYFIDSLAKGNADANTVANILNIASKGKADFISKTFGQLAYDAKKGFFPAQTQQINVQQAGAPQSSTQGQTQGQSPVKPLQ
ncbi:MAG: hypothetical protein PHS54_00350 [Clostridia bacterium]|nr:hypothetical protein [Clostridia bacterium]